MNVQGVQMSNCFLWMKKYYKPSRLQIMWKTNTILFLDFCQLLYRIFHELAKNTFDIFLPRKPPTLFVKNQQIFILLTTAYNLSHRLFSYLRKTFFPPPVEFDSQTTLNHVIIIFSCEEELRIYFVDVNTTPIFHI